MPFQRYFSQESVPPFTSRFVLGPTVKISGFIYKSFKVFIEVITKYCIFDFTSCLGSLDVTVFPRI